MIYKILSSSFFILLLPLAAKAGFLDRLPNSACMSSGNCSLNDIASGLIALINLLLGAVGAAALLYFFWGGIRWMTSFGSPERVKKGTDIMLNTIFALIIVFTSYVFLEFLVNRVLQVDRPYQITSECSGASRGTPCNASLGSNYVCDGQGTCLTRCELKNEDTVDADWRCLYVNNIDSYLAAYGGLYGNDIELNVCPGPDFICVRHVNGQPVTPNPVP